MGGLFLGLAIVCNALGNVFLKIGADNANGLSLEGGVTKLVIGNWALLLGIVFFVVNVFFYIVALRILPLSVAYPTMVGMTFLIVAGVGSVVLGESVGAVHILGYLLIAGGVVLISVFGA